MVQQTLSSLWFVAPDVLREAPELLDQLRIPACVVDRGFDLGTVADDACIAHQPRYVAHVETRHGSRLEVPKRLPEVVSLAQNGQPAEPRHEPFEDELLEEALIIS